MNALKALETTARAPGAPEVTNKVKKSVILVKYNAACHAKGISNHTSTITKGETLPTTTYPLHHHLIVKCKMKPSLKHQYQVKDLCLENVIIFVVRDYEHFGLTDRGDEEDPNINDLMSLLLIIKNFWNMV